MAEHIDLHCHWLPNIDDGPNRVDDSLGMLQELHDVGFDLVFATPHIRPGLYDNTRGDIEAALGRVQAQLAAHPSLPRVALGAEHYLDDVVFERLMNGEGLPYAGGRAVLIEMSCIAFPPGLERRIADLRQRGLLPVIAHPERYGWLWQAPERLERCVDAGAAAALNAPSLAGAGGVRVQRCAEELLERGLYHAAVSDAHCVEDVVATAEGLAWIETQYGDDEIEFLLGEGPAELLAGRVPQ